MIELEKKILPIYIYGASMLRKQCMDIAQDYPNLDQLIENMFYTMGKANGIGLSANQIGLTARICVVSFSVPKHWAFTINGEKKDIFKRVLINPYIIGHKETTFFSEEGCLSIPYVHEFVERFEKIAVKYCDEQFKEREDTFSGLGAVVIQHEIDHLNGKLFTDRINPLKKKMIKSTLNILEKRNARIKYPTI